MHRRIFLPAFRCSLASLAAQPRPPEFQRRFFEVRNRMSGSRLRCYRMIDLPSLFLLLKTVSKPSKSLTAADLSSLVDQVMRQTMDFAFRQASAHEGAVWLAEEATQSLTPVFDSGPHAEQFVGSFKQPLS